MTNLIIEISKYFMIFMFAFIRTSALRHFVRKSNRNKENIF